MKKKGVNVVLIIFLVIVWGLLGYRFFYKPKAASIDYTNHTPLNQQVYKKFSKDTFELNVTFLKGDPFLGTILKRKHYPNNKTVVKKKSTKKDQKNIWPKMDYLGFLKSNKSKYPLALLRLDAKLYRIRRNNEIKDITIKHIFEDSIILSKNKEIKVVKRKG